MGFHILGLDRITSKRVDVERDKESIEEVVRQDSIKRLNVESENIIDIVKMIKMFSNNIF